MAPLLIALGIPDFDASLLYRTAPRILTQNISAVVYAKGANGIRYLSKYGNDIENWAMFEPVLLSEQLAADIQVDDPDLLAACQIFNLEIG